MKHRPLILISNDDGIESPGLHAVMEALLPQVELIVAAPLYQNTATGRSMHANPHAVFEKRIISITGNPVEAWALDASPAVTTLHAMHCLLEDRKPDLMVSGINLGENIGTNITASGTVGAAIEAAVNGCKALAVSRVVPAECHSDHSYQILDWSGSIAILRKAVNTFIDSDWPTDVDLIKIDIPEHADLSTPWQVCRQSMEPGWWDYHPNGKSSSPVHSLISKKGPRTGAKWEPHSDGWAIWVRNEVAITPISIDMTSRISLKNFI